jgi:hypothetical protein
MRRHPFEETLEVLLGCFPLASPLSELIQGSPELLEQSLADGPPRMKILDLLLSDQ